MKFKTPKIFDSYLIGCLVGYFLILIFSCSYLRGVESVCVDTTPIPHIIKQQIYDKKTIVTGYNLEANQTDGEPCIGAGNHNLCNISKEEPDKCIIATRLYDLHRKLYIEGFGECEVLDRTAKKYGSRIDILFKTKEEAINFGKKELRYRVIN